MITGLSGWTAGRTGGWLQLIPAEQCETSFLRILDEHHRGAAALGYYTGTRIAWLLSRMQFLNLFAECFEFLEQFWLIPTNHAPGCVRVEQFVQD